MLCLLYGALAVYFAFASLSRSTIALTLLPLVYVWVRDKKSKLSVGMLLRYAAIPILVVFVAISVDLFRSKLYSGEELGDKVSRSMVVGAVGELTVESFLGFPQFIVTRIEGSRELMAVIGAGGLGEGALWKTFLNDDSAALTMEHVMGFSPDVQGRAYGMTYGLLGLLYLDGNAGVVFLGAGLYILLLMVVEQPLLQRGYVGTAFFVTFTLFIFVWANLIWFFIFRFGVVITMLYAFAFLLKRILVKQYVVKPAKRPLHGRVRAQVVH